MISDNGKGMDADTLKELNARIQSNNVELDDREERNQRNTGIALPNIHKRIQLLFGEEYGVNVYSTAGQGMIYVVTGSPSGDTAKNVADKVFFVPAAVYRGTDDVVPSFQPMGNLFEQCLLILFDIIIMTIVDETPGLTFEKMSKNHRNVE